MYFSNRRLQKEVVLESRALFSSIRKVKKGYSDNLESEIISKTLFFFCFIGEFPTSSIMKPFKID